MFSVFSVKPSKKMQTIVYRESQIWEIEKDIYTKSLAKNQGCATFYMQDIRKNVLCEFIKLRMEMPCYFPFEGHKYGHWKSTETFVFEFCYKCMNLSL